MRRFAKYHGLGNDFILIDNLQGGEPIEAATVRRWCDRHLGIGADGVLTLWPDAEAAARMQVHNADGSEAENCGNGLRCVARHLFDQNGGHGDELTLRSGQGLHRARRVAADRFRVGMGQASAVHADIPAGGATGEVSLALGGQERSLAALVLGNPHAVLFADEPVGALAARLGPELECHPAFPRRTNATFARRIDAGFEAAIFERGVGLTEACGSAACALGVAAVARGLWPVATPMRVVMPGGALVIEVDAHGLVSQEGEAVFVFSGEVNG